METRVKQAEDLITNLSVALDCFHRAAVPHAPVESEQAKTKACKAHEEKFSAL
jgi:hypothetical protein